jgi:hypothetical protein
MTNGSTDMGVEYQLFATLLYAQSWLTCAALLRMSNPNMQPMYVERRQYCALFHLAKKTVKTRPGRLSSVSIAVQAVLPVYGAPSERGAARASACRTPTPPVVINNCLLVATYRVGGAPEHLRGAPGFLGMWTAARILGEYCAQVQLIQGTDGTGLANISDFGGSASQSAHTSACMTGVVQSS